MNPAELVQYQTLVANKHSALVAVVDTLDAAADDVLSSDHESDARAEGLFLRAFTIYESHIDSLFFHYVTGGLTLQGNPSVSFLNNVTEEDARKIVRRGVKFISWAKPSGISDTAKVFLQNGWPLVDMMATKTQELADAERIRNRIAHISLESTTEFNTVQRNLLRTERVFPITPGQLLRIRHRQRRVSHLRRYLDVMNETVGAILDPPP